MPVPLDSTAVRDPPGQGATRDESVEEKRKKGTRQLYEKVNAFLNMPRTLQRIRAHIGAEGMQLIKNNRLMTLTRFMQLWGFKLVAGEWQRGGAASGSGVRQTQLK
jgi:phosphoenolpyruvate carboxylase